MYTPESSSLLQLLNSSSGESRRTFTSTGSSGFDPLIQVIRREGLERIEGDFLEIGSFLDGGAATLARLSAFVGKRVRVIQRDSKKAELPKEVRLAFALVGGNHDPASVRNDFRLVWKHLVAGGWAAFDEYTGDLPDVTAALNTMLTEHSAQIDRVERIKDKRVLLVRKRKS
jgi:hypothetical protein